MALSKYFLNAKYKSKNYLGMLVCVSGSMMIVYIDYNKNNGKASWIGDILCVVGASLYAMANVLQEYLIKNSPIEDYLTGIGGYGFVFSLILLAFEYKELSYFRMESNATMHFGMCISVFVISMFLLYSLVPRLIVKSSATMFNLSILTSDFYNLLAGVYIFGLKLTAIYGVAFAVIIVGLAIFHSGEKKRNDMGEEVVVI